jgi:hypothetical protein
MLGNSFVVWDETDSTWMRMEYLVKCELARETEVPAGNLPYYHFVHLKSHITTWDRTQVAEKLATNRLIYGTPNERD